MDQPVKEAPPRSIIEMLARGIRPDPITGEWVPIERILDEHAARQCKH